MLFAVFIPAILPQSEAGKFHPRTGHEGPEGE
jgi:hypothetical protein